MKARRRTTLQNRNAPLFGKVVRKREHTNLTKALQKINISKLSQLSHTIIRAHKKNNPPSCVFCSSPTEKKIERSEENA